MNVLKNRMRALRGVASATIASLLLLTWSGHLSGQVPKGKIAGKVTDAETKQGLPGANVIIQGTTLGAATGREGEYYILNVPPGTYTLVARMIGYRSVLVRGVTVVVDRTTTIDFTLETTVLEMAPLVVEAARPAVVRDLTATAKVMEAREIETAPVEGLRRVLELDAGVTRNPNGTFSIRGGGAFELQFQINGVEQIASNTGVPGYNLYGEKSNTSWKYDFNPLGVKQMEIISGGFSAEYGNAQSGVVKVVTKEGEATFHGELRVEIRPPGKYHFGPYLYGSETIEWQRWGTFAKWQEWRDKNAPGIPDDSLRTYYYNRWVANHSPGPNNSSNPLGVYDYRKLVYQRYMFGFGGPLGGGDRLRFYVSGEYRSAPLRIPSVERVQTYQNYVLNLSWRIGNADKLKLMGQYQAHHGAVWSGSDDIRWASVIGQYPTWKYCLVLESPKDEITTARTLSWTRVFGPRTFFEITAWHQRERYVERNLPIITATDPRLVPAGPWDEDFRRIVYEFTSLYALDAQTDVWNVSADLTSQVTPRHQLKLGARGQYWDTRYAGESGARINSFVAYSGFAEYYHAYPLYVAAYAQDKMEFQGMVVNAGLRLDAFNMNAPVPVDRFRPFYQGTGQGGGPYVGDVGDPRTRRSKSHLAVSPRFGLSFPVGERTAFRLQYGHFHSMPLFRHALSKNTWQGWRMYGNADLGFKKTVSYEVGLQQSLAGTHRLDVAAYYNDRVNQTVSARVHSPTGSQQEAPQNPYYLTYENNGYGASRGIEVALERVAPGEWKYRLSYAFARTSQGAYGAIDVYENPSDPRSVVERRSANDFLTEEDRTHSFRALLSYTVPGRVWRELLGGERLKDVVLTVIYQARSGSPFTYVTSYDEFTDVVNNRRYPLEAKTDLGLQVRVPLGSLQPLLSVRIENLLNDRWLTPLAGEELRNWVEYGISRDTPPSSSDPNDPQAKIYKLSYFRAYRNAPREIYFTVGLGF
ncbi:MAG: carboxypeptidase-like regulatory domain-containing protein [candidate division KSB1 bacterium]|nr:carboxypeptidase-like regulatory domain-containing protein [candidate division KSB1 bacterium]